MKRKKDGTKAPPGFRLAAITAMMCIFGISPLAAQTFWQGASGGNWNTAGNWSTGIVPGSANETVVNNIASNILLNSGSSTINSFNSTNSGANFDLFGGALSASVPGTSSFSMTGQLILQGGASMSGFVVTASGGAVNNGTATLNGLSFANSTSFVGALNSTTTVNGTLTNAGNFQINGGAGDNTTLALGSSTAFQGAGTITLNTEAGAGNGIISGNGFTLTNATTIQGNGLIGSGSLAVLNNGTIDANVSGSSITLNGGLITNSSLMEASGGGTLSINGVTVNNTGGNITVSGPSDTVQLINNARIQGGALTNVNGGSLGITAGTSAYLDGSTGAGALTINGTFASSSNTNTQILGAINVNGAQNGNIQVNGGNNSNSLLTAMGGAVTLTGGGSVTLNTLTGGGNAYIQENGATTLTNVNNTIQGSGVIGNNGLTLVNQAGGVINANSSGVTQTTALVLQGFGAPVVNQGLIEATGNGVLQISGGTINNGDGNITANSGASVQLYANATIQGGTLNNKGAFFGTVSGNSAFLNGLAQGPMTINGAYTSDFNTSTFLTGTFNNLGNIQVNGGNNSNTFLQASGQGSNVMLTGGGTITLNTLAGGGNAILQQNGTSTLENVNNTIQGTGIIGNNGLSLLNDAGGTVIANVPGQTLAINGANTVTNNGTFEANAGSTLHMSGISSFTNFTGNTLTGGIYIANGTLSAAGTIQINWFGSAGGEIVNNAGTIVLNGQNSNIVDAAGLDALSNLAANTTASSGLTITGGRNLTTKGDFSNAGNVWIGSGSTMQIGPTGANNYTQTGGITTVNGVLDPAGPAAVDIKGGILAGIGSVAGNVLAEGGSISPGGINVTSELTINGNLNDTGAALNIRLGGAGAGAYDVLDVTGNVNLGAGSTLDLSLINGFTPTNGETFTFLDFGGLTSEGLPDFFGNDNGLTTPNGTFALTDNGNDLSLTFTNNSSPPPPNGTPEPGSVAMFASGGLAWLVLRKRFRLGSRKGAENE